MYMYIALNLSHTIIFSRCYLKLGDWCTNLEEKNLTSSTISTILEYYKKATEHDTSWYKAWHAWAYMNFQALLQHKQQPAGAAAGGGGATAGGEEKDGRKGGRRWREKEREGWGRERGRGGAEREGERERERERESLALVVHVYIFWLQ